MRRSQPEIRNDAIATFRLQRHHLLDDCGEGADAITICRDMCGVQAQVMSAAYLQLWTRNHSITRSDVEDALWKSRTLVKTSLMRQTLHIIPSDEFALYIAAQRSCRVAQALRVMARFGITREEADASTALIVQALSSGPLRRPEILAALRPQVSKRVQAWAEKCWGLVRLPVAEGRVCYGSGEGNQAVFIRTDQWLPKPALKKIPPAKAQSELLRKFLRAYGPATLHDFAHWSGISMPEVRPLRPLVEADLEEMQGDMKSSLLLREDAAVLKNCSCTETCVRLLPIFDSYLLAHREKGHLLSTEHYKRVYRNQGWISPVVLINGSIAGVWSHKLQNKNLLVEADPFGRLTRDQRAAVEREAKSLAAFFESGLELKFS
jgi:uncharacterized protein YcaQ